MTSGEWLTRATIWLAMLAWTVAIVSRRASPRRWVWSLGLALYLFHILSAYRYFYDWDHRVAWAATARDTEQATGFDSGIGLLLNFAFVAILAADVSCQWIKGQRKWSRAIDALILFMITNGAIVFGEGAVRWYGTALVVVIVASWLLARLRARENSSGSSFLPP